MCEFETFYKISRRWAMLSVSDGAPEPLQVYVPLQVQFRLRTHYHHNITGR